MYCGQPCYGGPVYAGAAYGGQRAMGGGGQMPPRPAPNASWQSKWPFILTTIIAILILISSIAIYGLESASLAKGTDKGLYGNTSSTGAGIWCTLFFVIAAALILAINCVRNTRLWATIAFVATLIAAAFAVILLGLDAKAVQDGNNSVGGLSDKGKVLAAQLALAIFVLVLCFLFIIIYIIVAILARRR